MSALFKKQVAILEPYFKRKDLVEICINKEGEILLETNKGKWESKKDAKLTIEALRMLTKTMATMSGQEFTVTTPMYSGRIPNYNYRIQTNIGAQVESGIAISIRIGQSTVYPINSYMDDEKANRLIQLVKEGKTILVCAGTGCGKTTFLNSLLVHIPLEQRIITIEDTRELIVPHHNVVNMLKSKTGTDVAKLGYADFINACMRMRPDRILLGEIDIENSMIFLNLANSGHSGSISTIHAYTPEEAMNKLCLNASLSGAQGASREDVMEYAKSAVDVYVSLTKEIIDGNRVFSAQIFEVGVD
ncbi:hypothetical protein GNP80_05500 [Aliivibrio fischeri]|uniref:ATPase, T2SS/T4P/T4SS family n=1 Tax=Aliivibrio fischeri TaxID=668 RepID=UPI0012D863AF|nr:ATPase, T2SS/T4P/T4SS family [Aliivibrio fischeri]MUK91890.1 hypothetical protein [Aliivibrio fischeri]